MVVFGGWGSLKMCYVWMWFEWVLHMFGEVTVWMNKVMVKHVYVYVGRF